MPITFSPKWKEELVCSIDASHTFTIEMTMGSGSHIYFPTQQKWQSSAPDWALDLWEQAHQELIEWSTKASIPLTMDNQSWVSFSIV